eukprot:4177285-Heterocapsa_arctica.AAC.1
MRGVVASTSASLVCGHVPPAGIFLNVPAWPGEFYPVASSSSWVWSNPLFRVVRPSPFCLWPPFSRPLLRRAGWLAAR